MKKWETLKDELRYQIGWNEIAGRTEEAELCRDILNRMIELEEIEEEL